MYEYAIDRGPGDSLLWGTLAATEGVTKERGEGEARLDSREREGLLEMERR